MTGEHLDYANLGRQPQMRENVCRNPGFLREDPVLCLRDKK